MKNYRPEGAFKTAWPNGPQAKTGTVNPILQLINMVVNEAAGERKPEFSGTLRIFEPRTTTNMFSRYSETGMNCLIQFPKLPGLRLWI